MYIVTSKPKRTSLYEGVSHFMKCLLLVLRLMLIISSSPVEIEGLRESYLRYSACEKQIVSVELLKNSSKYASKKETKPWRMKIDLSLMHRGA
jgi:hypothetical protein